MRFGMFTAGDLVRYVDSSIYDREWDGYGIVVKVHNDIEAPSLIEVLWFGGDTVSTVYGDELTLTG